MTFKPFTSNLEPSGLMKSRLSSSSHRMAMVAFSPGLLHVHLEETLCLSTISAQNGGKKARFLVKIQPKTERLELISPCRA